MLATPRGTSEIGRVKNATHATCRPSKNWIRTALATFSAITTCVLITSCSHRTPPASFSIALEHGFEQSKVEVLINGRPHFKGVVTSDASMGLARTLPATGPCTQIAVKVRCKDGSMASQNYYPTPSRGFFIGVNFNPFFNKINFEQRDGPVFYD
ncbi:hypothetical protein [Prosthecobacter sp.]|uniref:hypothetical protein n=1 Tax=Prosthecobacter sp. TaxID=1965333 RepID=UPI003784FE17